MPHMKPRRPILLLCALTTLLPFGAVACSKKPAERAGPAPVDVTVLEVRPETVPIYSEYVAQTYSASMVEIRARVDGFIEKRTFSAGDLVKAGDVLYVLDLRPYQAQVAKARGEVAQKEAALVFAKEQVDVVQAQAQLAQARALLVKNQQDVARLEPLVRQEAAPRQDLDNAIQNRDAAQAQVDAQQANLAQKTLSTRTSLDAAQADLDAARAALATAQLNLEYATIRAPIGGRIGDTSVQVGGLVTANAPQPLTTIVPLDPISVRFKVSEAEYLAFQASSAAERRQAETSPLRLILADDAVYPPEGRIKRVLNQVDPRTGTLELQADFPNPKGTLLPGQFARVRAKFKDKENALLVPQRAVTELQGTRSVFTVGADNTVAQRTVVAAERVGERWVIDQGLKPGDRVIVEGLQKVRPGALVNAHLAAALAPAAPPAAAARADSAIPATATPTARP